eukprot:m.160708 g.160708  ORF g.160708 m.160708 type:complete len:349 (+) comp24829_c0_seq26:3-1049(+)
MHTDLGFAEEGDPRALTSRSFPSKLGGFPAWLDLKNLPDTEATLCSHCNKPLRFLLQVYSGGVLEHENAFHRTLFVFCCTSELCATLKPGISPSLVVLRSQLPRKNDFFSFDPPSEELSIPPVLPQVPLCCVCGLAGPKRCGQCKQNYYCSKVHQAHHWKNGHKEECTKSETQTDANPEQTLLSKGNLVFPEFELVVEPEPEEEEKTEEEKLADFKKFSKVVSDVDKHVTEKDMDSIENKIDMTLATFRERIDREPTQVLRFCRTGSPLFIGTQDQPDQDSIPSCPLCHSPRIFEFQIMPQVLNHLKLNESIQSHSFDWGVLAVYTCEKSCDIQGYVPEVIWHNPVMA